MSIGIQKLCKEKVISLLSLADRSGIALQRLQAIYQGRWTHGPRERVAIAQALETQNAEITWEHKTSVEHFYGPG